MSLTTWADTHLVPTWRKAHRFFSVRAAALQAAVLVAWPLMPEDMKAGFPPWFLSALAGFVLVVAVAGVLTNQKKLTGPPNVRNP